LALIESCQACSKKGIKTIEQIDGLCERCSINVLAYKRYANANIPFAYWNLDMKDFVGAANLLKLYNEIDVKSMYSNGSSYFLVGNNGSGKTTTATNILKLAAQKGYTCAYSTLSDIVAVLTESPFEEKYTARKELTLADFVCIDEVDNRFAPTENAADLFGRTLEPILRTRLQNKIPTILVSNSPNPAEAFNGAMKISMDSLYSSIKVIIAVGNDYRKEKGKINGGL